MRIQQLRRSRTAEQTAAVNAARRALRPRAANYTPHERAIANAANKRRVESGSQLVVNMTHQQVERHRERARVARGRKGVLHGSTIRANPAEHSMHCRLCGKGFSCAKLLEGHEHAHTGVKPYVAAAVSGLLT